MFNVQRVITPKVGKSELWFMGSARRLIMLFCKIISTGIRVTERTQNYEALADARTDGRNDTQKSARYNIISHHLLRRGIKRLTLEGDEYTHK